MNIQLFQQHLRKLLFFPQWIPQHICWRSIDIHCTYGCSIWFHWPIHSTWFPFPFYFYFYSPPQLLALNSKSKQWKSSSSVLHLQNCWGNARSFEFPHKFENSLVNFYKKCHQGCIYDIVKSVHSNPSKFVETYFMIQLSWGKYRKILTSEIFQHYY